MVIAEICTGAKIAPPFEDGNAGRREVSGGKEDVELHDPPLSASAAGSWP